ncbi:sensor domain-containing diguanylate cyclase [Sporosarcina jeotgali]|uniref:Sensor domain-containing diguanylate cyclase n=1 Tax=Sporosarcina jeotgali TaxID=3020056 RepID=A0ABZ0KS98_9BACL|nr:sensor domain-containing diguanylate cyclase [Sporosarcina sp. B2O-1]WOV82950.1 sensor domain-containing diguanylate cyclase [Sporosarcina sp. B2O-1]
MKLNGRPLLLLLLLWILVVPTGIVYLLVTQPIPEVNWLWVGLSVLLGFLSIQFPVKYRGSSIILFSWFTLPLFLLYGLSIEIIVTQLIVLIASFTNGELKNIIRRILFNSLSYFILSISSASAFYIIGGEKAITSFWFLSVCVLVYQIVYSILYDWIFKLYRKINHNLKRETIKETILHYLRMIIVVPLSLSLYFLLMDYGFIGYVILGLPFFFITIVIRLNSQTEDLNESIKTAGEIGKQLTALKEEARVVNLFMSETSDMFHADYVYMFKNIEDWLEMTHLLISRRKVPVIEGQLLRGQGIAGKILLSKKPVLYSKREEWINQSVKTAPENLESLLCIPLVRNSKIEGVLILGSNKVKAFKDYHLRILDLLSSYFVIAVEKARYIEEAQRISDRCELTGLYNYKIFEQRLESDMEMLNSGVHTNLSVVMLDIDRFKLVNDTYGHESGNEILKQLANLLNQMIPLDGLLARYGGEEFVYLVPNSSKDQVLEFAESVRKEIRNTPMYLYDDLANQRNRKTIHITSSIGISTAPQDTDEAMTLLRNADRALYIGAKQAGRNRVAGYQK